MLLLLVLIFVALTGVTEGAGVLPEGPLNAAVGGSVMFSTTMTPTETPFSSVTWTFGAKKIITSRPFDNGTAPEYEGRITIFPSTGSLELRNLTTDDTGEYGVNIDPGPTAPVRDGTTTLHVYELVSNVIVNPSSADVDEGSSISLKCSSSGSSLFFRWMNNSSEVTAGDSIQLTDENTTLTIVNVTRYDKGPYTCHVSNPASQDTSNEAKLNIIYGPENIKVTVSPPPQEYYAVGSNITMTCSASSNPPSQYKWFLNETQPLDTGPKLAMMNVKTSQSGNYSCQAFIPESLRTQTSPSVAINILEKITGASITTSTNQPVEGTTVNLTCEASGSIFTRNWRKDGAELVMGDNTTFYDNKRVLSFNTVTRNDKGEYMCKISNPISGSEAKYNMIVYYGPDKPEIKGDNPVKLGSTITLTCTADSVPSAIYSWLLNGTEKPNNSDKFSKNNADYSDSGNYTCKARNEITEETSSVVFGLSVTATLPGGPGCSAGCIAGIVIACIVLVAAVVGGGYYFYHKKKSTKKPANRNTSTTTGGGAQDNAAYSNEELNYADIKFVKKNGGTVQLGMQNNTSDYAEIRVNSNRPAAPSPPSYDAHIQRTKGPAPQPGAQLYAQVQKNRIK